MAYTPEQARAIRAIAKAVVDTVNETPTGAPGGLIYAALMAHGVSFSQYQGLMRGLLATGKVRQEGDLFFAGDAA